MLPDLPSLFNTKDATIFLDYIVFNIIHRGRSSRVIVKLHHPSLYIFPFHNLLVIGTACSGTDRPTAPTVTNTPATPVVAAPTGTPGFPPIVKPARVFPFEHQLSFAVMDYTKGSRYVLYDDGTFSLQYTRGFEYPGKYTTANGVVTLVFQGAGWTASGSLQGDELSVRYNQDMSLSDFEDAVYLKTSS